MSRRAQIAGAAGAAVGFGFVLWALASTNLPDRFNQMFFSPSSSTSEATPAVAVPVEPVAPPVAGSAPRRIADALAIEIARIDAGGASVLAGRAPPNHRITVIANGREIATTVASDEGQWSVIVTEGIAAGPLELTLSSRAEGGGPVVTSTPRQLVVPAPVSPQVAAVVPNTKPPIPAKAATSPSPDQGRDTAPSVKSRDITGRDTKSGDASDKRALADFEALVAKTRSDMARDGASGAVPSERSSAGSVTATSPTASAGNSVMRPPVGQTTVAAAPASTTNLPAATAADAIPDPAQIPIPVPITFMTDDTTLTSDGARAAALLAEYLRLKRPEAISLSGHADSRGPHGYNMELSRQRLEVIERYLRAAGYTGQLSLMPRGKAEPYRGVDRTRLSRAEIYQADRRVELRITP